MLIIQYQENERYHTRLISFRRISQTQVSRLLAFTPAPVYWQVTSSYSGLLFDSGTLEINNPIERSKHAFNIVNALRKQRREIRIKGIRLW